MAPVVWNECIDADIAAGASYVTLETRESGTSGLCRSNGELRYGLVEEILTSGVDVSRLVFEAPSNYLQNYFVKRVGPDVNLGNISAHDVARPRDDPTRAAQRDPAQLRGVDRPPDDGDAVRESRDVFHLAIPSYDLDATVAFYVAGLGCRVARRYDDRVTLDFFGDQLVCHLTEEPADRPALEAIAMYPRHFGVTFRDAGDFERVYQLCRQREAAALRRRSRPIRGPRRGPPDLRRLRPVGQPARVQALRRPADDVLRWSG